MGRSAASCRGQPVIFSATRIEEGDFPELSVQTTASPMQLSVTWARSFSANRASSIGLALDGIAQGPEQPARLDLAFDEIVLRAFLQGSSGQGFVIQPRQHHQGVVGRDRADPPKRSQPMRVGQSQVQQDNVNPTARQILFGVAQTLHVVTSILCALGSLNISRSSRASPRPVLCHRL